MTWKDKQLIIVDCETTGLEHGEHRIIELAWLLWQGGQVLEQHSYLLDPERELDEEITSLTGITDAMLEHATTFEQVAAAWWSDVERSAAVVAYNAPFDKGHLAHEHDLAQLRQPMKSWLDPLVWVRHFDKYAKGKKLTQVAERLGVKAHGDPHRALTDCHLCAGVMAHYMPRLLDDLDDLEEWQIDQRREQEADFQRWLARQNG